MKKPVEWWHLLFQTTLFVSALLGMLWNFSTSSQKQKDDIETLKSQMIELQHGRHEDAMLQKADMDELKGSVQQVVGKVDDLRVLIENKKDRDK